MGCPRIDPVRDVCELAGLPITCGLIRECYPDRFYEYFIPGRPHTNVNIWNYMSDGTWMWIGPNPVPGPPPTTDIFLQGPAGLTAARPVAGPAPPAPRLAPITRIPVSARPAAGAASAPLRPGVPAEPAPAAAPIFGRPAPQPAEVRPEFVLAPPPVDPVTAIVAGISALLSVLRILGGRGLAREVESTFRHVYSTISTVADGLMRFSWSIGRAVGFLYRIISNFWVRVLRPLLDHARRLGFRLARIYDRIVKPVLAVIERYRRLILRLYEKYARPVLTAIQRVRRALFLLRILRVGFAQKLDDRLARLEGKIAAPFLFLLSQLNELAGWINLLVTIEYLLRDPLLINSLYAYQGDWINIFWSSQTSDVAAGTTAALTRLDLTRDIDSDVARYRAESASGAGQLGQAVQSQLARLRGSGRAPGA